MLPNTQTPALLTPADFLTYWLGHRRLTRRVIEAFPEDQLFGFTPAPPVRSFGQLAWEIHGQQGEIGTGLVEGIWGPPTWNPLPSTDKADLLHAWDDLGDRLQAEVPGVPLARYGELTTYHRYDEPVLEAALGEIDNEIHHRGQGMVYLRLLGITPPDFWER